MMINESLVSDLVTCDVNSYTSILQIHGDAEVLVSLASDGTVTIHKHGAEREAAELFWRCVEITGRNLYNRIATLEAELANAKRA